jgi:glutathione S-transferase
MPAIELFTANFSPFGQRVRLALLEKGLDFLHTEIDLTAKPEWFLIISPLGQVPVIRHEDRFVSNSSVILEYLEDVYPIPSLRPRDPKTRAVIRFWTDYADEKLVAGIVAAVKAEGEKRGPAREQLREILAFIEREGMARCSRGPYWLGKDLTLLDIIFYPLFERLPAIPGDVADEPPLISKRMRFWLEVMSERPSVKVTQNPVASHARAFQEYLGLKPRRRRVGNVEYLQA